MGLNFHIGTTPGAEPAASERPIGCAAAPAQARAQVMENVDTLGLIAHFADADFASTEGTRLWQTLCIWRKLSKAEKELSDQAALSIKSLSLQLEFTARTPANPECVRNLARLAELKSLMVNLRGQIESVNWLHGFQTLAKLESLTLDFSGCMQLAEVNWPHGLAKLTKLESLILDFSYCSKLAGVSGLQDLDKMSSLESVALKFSRCLELADANVLRGLNNSATLKSLTLDLSFSQFTDVSFLQGLKLCSFLLQIRLDFS